MNMTGRIFFIITIFFAGVLTRCSGNVVFDKELRRQPSSTGSILMEIAKELVERSKSTNQVLNLNLSNLLLLMVLKAVVYGANYFGNNNSDKSRGLDPENLVSEEEISLALGYLIGDKCLYRAACEMPNTAKDYLDAVDIILQTLKLMPETIPLDNRYEETVAEFRKAIEYGAMERCPPEYSCKKQNIKKFLRTQ